MGRSHPRFPLFRLGMLLVVGAVAVSLFDFYIGFGALLSDLEGRETPPETREELGRYFLRTFFLTGSLATFLFWGGMLLCLLGVVRNFGRARRAREE